MEKTKTMRTRNLFIALTLMSGFSIVAFRFNSGGLEWLWTGMVRVPAILGILSVIFGILSIVVSKSIRRENNMKKTKVMKRRNLFMALTLMSGFSVTAFKFNNEGLEWFWTGMTPIPVILGISSVIFGIFWFMTSKSMKKEIRN